MKAVLPAVADAASVPELVSVPLACGLAISPDARLSFVAAASMMPPDALVMPALL